MVGAILTQNTAWTNVEKAIISLKKAKALSVPRVAAMPRRRLEKLIRSSGFFRQKAERLKGFSRYLRTNPGFFQQLCGHQCGINVSRDSLSRLRQRLLFLNGIGPETADSILLYAGGYPVFVVDAYTRRIGQRIGLFKYNDYDRVQDYFARALPRKSALYNEYHAQMVRLAKNYCTRRRPKCGQCPVLKECGFGRKRVNGTSEWPR